MVTTFTLEGEHVLIIDVAYWLPGNQELHLEDWRMNSAE